MSTTFNPNQKLYQIGTIQGTTLVVKEEKISYKTKSEGHAKVHAMGINNFKILEKSTLITFLYMLANINREPRATWANLGQYFQDGYLCFAKHQSHMATDRMMSQPQIGRHLKELIEVGFIREIGKEFFQKKRIVPITVYALGEFDIYSGSKIEIHYYELDKEKLAGLIDKGQSLFYHNRKYVKKEQS